MWIAPHAIFFLAASLQPSLHDASEITASSERSAEKPAPAVAIPEPAADRYVGKPLLRIIKLFVLDTIGELSAEQAKDMQAMTPKLQGLFKSKSSWQGIVVELMDWNATSIRSSIQATWQQNQRIAREQGLTLTGEQFARMFVDANVPQDD